MSKLSTYIIRRILLMIPVLFGISLITFLMIHLVPGGPINYILEQIADVPPEMILYWRTKMGLDEPLHIQYLIWLRNIITGDLGASYVSGIPVTHMISSYWMWTFRLSLASIILSFSLSIPLGIMAAVKKDSIFDNISRVVSLFGVSMPNFWLSLMAILFFSVQLGLFPVYGAQTIGGPDMTFMEKLIDQLRHMILPLSVSVFSGMALTTRLVRSSMLDILNQEYIMTARAKGVRERVVVYKHAFRNALLPVVTVFGLSFGFILSGSVTLESVFAWPGMGRFMVRSAFMRDYTAIMAVTMIVGTMVVVSTVITDIAYAFLDPRIRV